MERSRVDWKGNSKRIRGKGSQGRNIKNDIQKKGHSIGKATQVKRERKAKKKELGGRGKNKYKERD